MKKSFVFTSLALVGFLPFQSLARVAEPDADDLFRQRQAAALQAAASDFDPSSNRPFENRVQHGFHLVFYVSALEVNRRGLGSGATVAQTEGWLRSMTETFIERLADTSSSSWNSDLSGVAFSPAVKYAPMMYGYLIHQYGDDIPQDIWENVRFILEDSPMRLRPSTWIVNGRINVLTGQLLGGEALGHDSSLWQTAFSQLNTVYQNTMLHSGLEMNAPVYGNYQYSALAAMLKLEHAGAFNRGRIMLDNQLMVAGHLYLPGGGIGVPRSRDRQGAYGGSQTLPQHYYLFFGEPASYSLNQHAAATALGDYRPPEIIESFFREKPDTGYEFWTYTPNPLGNRMPNTIYDLGPDNVRVSPWHAVVAPAGNAMIGLAYGHRGFAHHISMGAWVRDANGNFQVFYHHNPMVIGDTFDNGNNILGDPSSDPDDWRHEGYDYERLLWGRTLLSIWDPTTENKPANVVRTHQDTRARIPNLANYGGEMIQHEGWYVGSMGESYIAYYPLGEIDLAEPRGGGNWFYVRLAGKSGCIMEMATTDDFPTVQDYAADLASRHRAFVSRRGFYVEFDARDPETGDSRRLRLEYDPERRFIDGEEFTIAEYDQGFINSPWIDWDAQNRVKTVSREGYPTHVYDVPSATVSVDDGTKVALVLIETRSNPATQHGIRNFLEENGYYVTISSEWAGKAIGAGEIAQIESDYDLVIFSTEALSSFYNSSGWQSLSIPILAMNPFLPVHSAWGWAGSVESNPSSNAFDVGSFQTAARLSVPYDSTGAVPYRENEAAVSGIADLACEGTEVLKQDAAVFVWWETGALNGNAAPRASFGSRWLWGSEYFAFCARSRPQSRRRTIVNRRAGNCVCRFAG